MEKNKERDVSVKKNRNIYFCVAYSRYFSTAIHRVIDRLKKSFNLTCPSGVLNRLAKLTSWKSSIQEEAMDTIYPAHANTFRKAGLSPPVLPTMRELWEKQDEKLEKNWAGYIF